MLTPVVLAAGFAAWMRASMAQRPAIAMMATTGESTGEDKVCTLLHWVVAVCVGGVFTKAGGLPVVQPVSSFFCATCLRVHVVLCGAGGVWGGGGGGCEMWGSWCFAGGLRSLVVMHRTATLARTPQLNSAARHTARNTR